MKRCIVVSPRHAFIRPWIRAYFATGNTVPLVIVPGPPGDWKDGDMEYCEAAARFSGGMVFDCSGEWENSRRLAARAVRKSNAGWYTKKSILHAVATRLKPESWAWIDDDAEVTGCLDECFDMAEQSPGFICAQFYYPSEISNRHPARMYRSNIDPDDKICWNSLVFFHGDANDRLSEELGKDFPVEDDEIVFGYLYKNNPAWHEGFLDFSSRRWQINCKTANSVPRSWYGKLIHYTTMKNGGEVKKIWAAKANTLPNAPFEYGGTRKKPAEDDDGPIDAVFVIGTGSIKGNEELRYALRNIEKHCKFVRDVYICGFCPSWVDRTKVKHLQWPDRFQHAKDANIIDKLRHACEHPGIAKRILFCSDDQFQTRECTWDDFAPRYLRRYSPNDDWYELRKRPWHTRLRKTMQRDFERRKAAGLDTKNIFYWQPHIWMPMDRDLFLNYARWCSYETREDTIIASGYYNFIDAKGRQDFDHMFIGNDSCEVAGVTHVAYFDNTFDRAMEVLKKMFPERSRFELPERRTSPSTPSADNLRVIPMGPQEEIGMAPDDPSRATQAETLEITKISSVIRNNPVWHGLLGEVSRAEELRLFGVKGWRTVWRDIIWRWRSATCNGTDPSPVSAPRSDAASKVVNAYMSNPDAMRTVKYGPQPVVRERSRLYPGRQLPRPASEADRETLRYRVRKSLHGRA